MVPETLDFLAMSGESVDSLAGITIEAGVIGLPGRLGPIVFQRKAGGRMRIANQNRQQPNSPRHPAWTAEQGFPLAPDDVGSTDEALHYFPDGGLRIFVAKDYDGLFYAGFNKGPRPLGMTRNDVSWEMYEKKVGGVIRAN